MKVIIKHLELGRHPMKCVSAEAEALRYKKYKGKSGKTWLIADQPNCADNIYVEGGCNSDGFGGRTLTFMLCDGSELSLKGPWKSNADDFFNDTGIDIRDKFYGRITIAEKFNTKFGNYGATSADNVYYHDEEWTLGVFAWHRGKELAQKIANATGKTVFLNAESNGGSCKRAFKPKEDGKQ